jgi:tRNA uridine 5-carbamoylmethylation protein Kti12
MLIGLPGSGKTTYRDQYVQDVASQNYLVISQDDLVEEFASANGLTYTEAFKQADLKSFDKKVRQTFNDAIDAKRAIVLDRTNLTAKTRRGFLNRVTGDYKRIAIVFEIHPIVLADRLEKRARATGKVIPEFVIRNMRKSYEAPTSEEFDIITTVRAEEPNLGMYLRHVRRVVVSRLRRILKTRDK